MSERAHHRPQLPGAGHFEAIETTAHGVDPAVLAEAAERAATALVRGARDQADSDLVSRVVHLADTEGLETLADLWAGAPSDSLAGALWRLYLLRTWVHADPRTAAQEFDRGRALAPVAEAISGVEEPPGADEVRSLVDAVLSGVVVGEFADTLFRAAAFARVTAAGRARTESDHGSSYQVDLSASRLLTLADQLHHAARLELEGRLT
ncbi:hypothetical protein EFK50_06580 [Nocardioides marmoriginsengisoli]|uniref:DNA-directed RNA polymerase subunit beta n=1 Tax=Nocardioides marmoriginsengisoli TaxID=661483 RepID=A0A3N0CL60_9ACTN|nr:hypothetical protein [Nocardioides marmoriginsengisoli]RNL64194.1 hypothetical protein EFK50_06580 [Nocardioides marmoriginsengisoli]